MFAFDDAAARISAKCPLSCADRPNAVNASVTMSDVVAKSSPDAAARFMIPSIPFSMSSVFQPAIAMYSSFCYHRGFLSSISCGFPQVRRTFSRFSQVVCRTLLDALYFFSVYALRCLLALRNLASYLGIGL